MNLEMLINDIEAAGDKAQSEKMAAYMQNKFKFCGVPKPELKKMISPFLKETAKLTLDWDIVMKLWNCDGREFQYVALEYLGKHKKQLISSDLEKLKYLIENKSWWETVDTIDAFVGELVLKDENLKPVLLEWARSDNIWLKRVAIDYQQEYKQQTDVSMLEKIILCNLGSQEFFINKAIGWSLRDYSKVNPEWVKQFIESNKSKMNKLSISEASKYL